MKKKDKYIQRMINIEKSSMNLRVFITGGMASECAKVNKRLAKSNWKMQGALCFCHDLHQNKAQLCTVKEHPWLAALRGFWGKQSDIHLQDLTDIDFGLIPGSIIC